MNVQANETLELQPKHKKITNVSNSVTDISEQSDRVIHSDKCYHILYFTLRYFIICTCFYLSTISTIYAISNLISLEAVNPLCPLRSASDVAQHSRSLGLNGGDMNNSCWTIDRVATNDNAVKELHLDIPNGKTEQFKNLPTGNIISLVLFFLSAICLFAIAIQNLYYTMCDTKYFIAVGKQNNKLNPRIQSVHQKWSCIETVADTDSESESRFKPHNIYQWYQSKLNKLNQYMYFDSKCKVLSTISAELFEIAVQFYGVLLYGGIDLLNFASESNSNSNNNIGGKNVVLSQEYQIIETFAIIVGLNCIFAAIAWFMHVFWPNTWHGALFFGLIFFVDTIFEIIYTLFPVLYLTNGSGGDSDEDEQSLSFWHSLGLLKQENTFLMLQVLIAIVLLGFKCRKLMNELDPAYIENNYYIVLNQIKLGTYTKKQPWIMTKEWVTYQQMVSKCLARARENINNENKSPAKPITTSDTTPMAPTNDNDAATNIIAIDEQDSNDPSEDTYLQSHDNDAVLQLMECQIVPFEDKLQATLRKKMNQVEHNNMVRLRTVSMQKLRDNGQGAGGETDDDVKSSFESFEDNDDVGNTYGRPIVFVLGVLLLLTCGICMLVSFIVDIETNFKDKCINIDHADRRNYHNSSLDDTWQLNHAEISQIYSKYCVKKVVNLFDKDYPCNCRELQIDSKKFSNDESQIGLNLFDLRLLSNVFEQWTMLQAFYIDLAFANVQNSPYGDYIFNLTESHVQIPHLKTFISRGLNIGTIDDTIYKYMTKLKILNIERVTNQLDIPWDKISKIETLEGIRMENIDGGFTKPMGENICAWQNLRYLYLQNGDFPNGTIIPDCIGDNLIKLEYLALFISHSDSMYVSPRLFQLPKITTIIIASTPLDLSSFTNFSGYNENSLRNVWFSDSDVCDILALGNINTSNNINTTFDDYDYSDIFIDFINYYQPCYQPCGGLHGSTGCTAINFNDGVCDYECFDQTCGWDGGDCNQLCHCNQTLLTNGICDTQCNTSQCFYDYQSCININGTCYDGLPSNNGSDICYSQWITNQDEWCDDNCRYIEACLYDRSICQSCSGDDTNCGRLSFYFSILAQNSVPFDLITMDEVCDNWNLLLTIGENDLTDLFANCSLLFDAFDTNDNDIVGLHETIVGLATANFFGWNENFNHEKKLKQINCSVCVEHGNLTLYNL